MSPKLLTLITLMAISPQAMATPKPIRSPSMAQCRLLFPDPVPISYRLEANALRIQRDTLSRRASKLHNIALMVEADEIISDYIQHMGHLPGNSTRAKVFSSNELILDHMRSRHSVLTKALQALSDTLAVPMSHESPSTTKAQREANLTQWEDTLWIYTIFAELKRRLEPKAITL